MEQFNDQRIQEARSVIRAIGGEHATGGDKRLALRRHFALDSFEAAYELQQAAEQPQTWQEAGRMEIRAVTREDVAAAHKAGAAAEKIGRYYLGGFDALLTARGYSYTGAKCQCADAGKGHASECGWTRTEGRS